MLGFLDATTHLYKRSCPSVGPSVRPVYFRKTKIEDFDEGKSSDNTINNARVSDDEVVASYGPPRSLFSSHFPQLHVAGPLLNRPCFT